MFKDFLKDNLGRTDRPNYPVKSQAKYVDYGYGQVEPNHLSAQRNGKIYAQLPANKDIDILEQGQFVKYDYAANNNGIGEVNFTGKGEWMLVYNEIKLYKLHQDGTQQWDCEFAMIKDDYQARIYSPYDYEAVEYNYATRYLNGVDADGNSTFTVNTNVDSRTILDDEGNAFIVVEIDGARIPVTGSASTGTFVYNGITYTLSGGKVTVPVTYSYDDVTTDVRDIYELGWTNDPYHKLGVYREKKMPAGTAMVPRVFKTDIGDIYTTNTINEDTLVVGDILTPAEGTEGKGILVKADEDFEGMQWQVVKIYTMPDGQPGVKVMRIA